MIMARKTVSKKDKKQDWKPSGRAYTKRTEKPEKLKKGEVLEGQILAIQAGADSPVLAIKEDSTGKTRRVWMSTILQNSITIDDIGSFCAILCKGKTETKAGRKLNDFDVYIAEPMEGDENSSGVIEGDETDSQETD